MAWCDEHECPDAVCERAHDTVRAGGEMMDRADEIARQLWGKVWDLEHAKGIPLIAVALREYAQKVVEEDRRQICAWINARGWIAAQIREGKK